MSYFESVLFDYGAEVSSPEVLYTDLFHLGENLIQRTGEYRSGGTEFKGNPMIYVNDAANLQGRMKRYILLEDTFLDQIKYAQGQPSNLINAVSYYGKKKDKDHADRCFGLIFDIDDVCEQNLRNFLYGMRNDIYPCPNYIVRSKSGAGMHLYYIFDEPLCLYPKIKIQLKEIKYELTRQLWNPNTSSNESVQYQSYDQSFMVAGTYDNMKVYKLVEKGWSIEPLCEYAYLQFDKEDLWMENKHTLEEAKKLYPEWYQKVIVEGDTDRSQWVCKRDLYNWWKKKVITKARYGHRYWCVMMLVIYAVKCGVPFKEVKKDAYELMPILNSIKEDYPFTEQDVKSALDCYDVQFATFPIDDISRLSNIEIEKNKRNGRTQEQHCEVMRAIQNIVSPNWREGNGRKPKNEIVMNWRTAHPEGTKAECIRQTGLSKPTVYKWW